MSAMEIRYRQAVPEDRERIDALFARMLESIYGPGAGHGYAPGDLDRYFAGGEDRIFAAEEEGRGLIAFLSAEVHREEPAYLYLDDLSVAPERRGRGIGTALIRRAEDYARSLALPLSVLHAEGSNTRARRLYERLGYRICGQTGTRFRMYKRLLDEEAPEDYIRSIRPRLGHRKILLNSAGAVVVREGEILLQRRSDNGGWGLPGGLLELNETYAAAALREVREETGLCCRLTGFLGLYHNYDMMWPNGDRAHTLGAIYTAEIAGGALRRDGESLELRFFPPEELPELCFEDHRAALADYLASRVFPLLRENGPEEGETMKGAGTWQR